MRQSEKSPAAELYSPTSTERARQGFVLSLKFLANGAMQARVRETPEAEQADPAELARTPEFRAWAVLTHKSQGMMWDSVEPTVQRAAPIVSGDLRNAGKRRGSLELDPTLEIPEPIRSTEIHRQPGGYTFEGTPHDGSAGLRYYGTSKIYSTGKGDAEGGTDERGSFIVRQLAEHFPGIAPRRILDLGCGVGVASQTISRAFPDAEYHALDVAAGLLRFGHVLAERRGVPIHFHQRDAAHTGFPDAHFDLIVSNILFHETNDVKLPEVMRECRRVLAPGGAMLHLDVATQKTRLGFADRVMNDWQVNWNGEPFWERFAGHDLRADMIAAGFAEDGVFAGPVSKPGGSAFQIFGARG